MQVTINAGGVLTLAPGANLINLEKMTIHPGGAININGELIQNNTLHPIIWTFRENDDCKPIDFDNSFYDYDDHDGSAPLIGIAEELPLVEAY
jgi:hypothetical protein